MRHNIPTHETKHSIPDHLYALSTSEIELSNSELRQIDGSTVRMQHDLSFMQMELYEVKAEVNFQQEKY